MIKEIGSTYWLSQEEIDAIPSTYVGRPCIDKAKSYVSTCRSAIGLILDEIDASNKIALLPAFTCESVLYSFLRRGYKVYPYQIERNLNVNWTDFNSSINEYHPSVILVHSYFGFNTLEALNDKISGIQSSNIYVIEDCTQSMFSGFTLPNANFYTGSIRKWMPIPDGAFVSVSYNDIEEDTELCVAKMKALKNKGNWIMRGIGRKSDFRNDFSKAENILNSRNRTYAMSSLSKAIFSSIDIEALKQIRRENYNLLASSISSNKELNSHLILPLPTSADSTCPFHLPVLVKERRKELQNYLASNDIFATVIWACPEEFEKMINENVKYIYDHILCFHVDQRYDCHDMMRIIDTLKNYYNDNKNE
jgi:dTDP-4-amino-4,6-dideoxygalactose transaminase